MRLTSVPIYNVSDAFGVLLDEVRRTFGVDRLDTLPAGQQRDAVVMLVDMGVLHLREAVLRLSIEFGRSRVWVYGIIKNVA